MVTGMHDANGTEQLGHIAWHIYADLVKDIGDNLDKFVNKAINMKNKHESMESLQQFEIVTDN